MAEHPRIGRSQRALVGAAAMVVVLAVGLAACGGDDPQGEAEREGCGTRAACRDTTPPTIATSVAPVELTFRPVLSTTVPIGSGPADTVAGATGTDMGASCPDEPVTISTETATSVAACGNGVVVGTYTLGPVTVAGTALASARAYYSPQTGEWVVNPVFKAGTDGIDGFNAIAGHCYQRDAICPTGELAIVMNGTVLAAPTVQTPRFEADQIQISGNFTEESANALAAGINAAG
jgi:hypothetical protein